ncbi:lipoprotein-releasing ABC transporter permease subunit [Amorphus orientalis]|uniref:Lipoprotein-releasing system permease protein n=1 Tax=Amorphus orientalis TaxID=649198 RepID=A0AAE4ASR4_9HYPH|nr:lipoprotein-releasing ABC transporter permease subunit [Amorphus orientalis]MDQ0315538.1 lipoprotein-releasing system permease protein [Amorphus orientalis]
MADSAGAPPAVDGSGSIGAFSALEWLIAGRYLRSRRRDTFISVIAGFSFLGIMLGVATLIIVMAVMNGFRSELFDKILGINGHFQVQPIGSDLTDYVPVAQRIDGVDGVEFAIPYVEGQALVSGPSAATGALVRGVSPDDLERMDLISGNLFLGDLTGFREGGGVIIGSRLAASLGVTVEDSIRLLTPEGDVTPFGMTPRSETFPIAAIFEVGMSEYDSSIIYMPLSEAQYFFNKDDTVTAIEVFVDDPDRVDALRDPIQVAAERQVYLIDWRQRNTTFFSALEVERNVMFLILTLIVLVAVLNIISGLTMLVKDKARDIAILRTMGASRGTVLRIFILAGLSIGAVGTLAGLALGTVVCLNIEEIRQAISWLTRTELFSPELYFLSRLPAEMETGETTAVVVMALVLSFLATLYPAWKAAAVDPVEGLRSE